MFAVVLLVGCAAVSEPYQQPVTDMPARWSVGVARADWPDRQWWSAFGSRELDAMIGDALGANHELLAAAARVEQARANARIVSAGLYPSIGADASAGRKQIRWRRRAQQRRNSACKPATK